MAPKEIYIYIDMQEDLCESENDTQESEYINIINMNEELCGFEYGNIYYSEHVVSIREPTQIDREMCMKALEEYPKFIVRKDLQD
jgi:hypothetical protein